MKIRLFGGLVPIILLPAILIFSLFTPVTNANLIDNIISDDSLALIGYQNQFTDKFTSPEDAARIFINTQGAVPDVLLDSSKSDDRDDYGIVDSSVLSKPFFGIVDTVNPDNELDEINAFWQFDISSTLTSALQLSFAIEMAAMGDFETGDWFQWHYQIDGARWQTLFASQVNEDASQSYQLASGKNVELNDPMMVGNRILTNAFSHFNHGINGAGQLLNVRLTAITNAGTEAFAFRQMSIKASEVNQVNSIPEPESLSISLAILLGFHLLRIAKNRH
ncbi:hypothetical protein [Colwellia sp. MEBiC06753]